MLCNNVLIIAGTLVGASGTILTLMMAKAMNRSIANVAVRRVRPVAPARGAPGDGEARQVRVDRRAEDAAIMLAYAEPVVIVPGYGMAVAQAQHAVARAGRPAREARRRREVRIHPVAGRMPGHMNVLLAEADVPYDQLNEMDEINPEFPRTDVALVIGANDVTNPAAQQRPGKPDLRHADPRRRQGPAGHRAQAQHEPRLRRHRQRALLRAEDVDALRRRQKAASEIVAELKNI